MCQNHMLYWPHSSHANVILSVESTGLSRLNSRRTSQVQDLALKRYCTGANILCQIAGLANLEAERRKHGLLAYFFALHHRPIAGTVIIPVIEKLRHCRIFGA